MALFRPNKGTIIVIKGDRVEQVPLLWCEQCKLHHIDANHAKKHIAPVEPDIKVKET